jgi:putative sigma-54 modulation protein
VVAAGFKVSDDLRRGVERRLLYALSRFGVGVERVAVRLSDEANPLGGFDRRCRMQAWLRRHDSVRVETVDGPLAIDRAVGRLTERVEWTLVDGRAEDETCLMPELSPPSAQERVRATTRHASRARLVGGAGLAERKKSRR